MQEVDLTELIVQAVQSEKYAAIDYYLQYKPIHTEKKMGPMGFSHLERNNHHHTTIPLYSP